jgi:hypothetical protein
MATINGTEVVLPPPEGYVVNFEDPPRNLMTANYVVYAIGLTMSAMFLAQRVFVKIHIQNGMGLEDCMSSHRDIGLMF